MARQRGSRLLWKSAGATVKKFILFSLVIFELIGASTVRASFEENSRRYLSGPELIDAMATVIGPSIAQECNSVTKATASLLGVNQARNGEPVAGTPTQALVIWVSKCVQAQAKSNSSLLISNSVGMRFRAEKPAVFATPFYESILWNAWSTEVKKTFIRSMVENILGPDEVILDYGFIDNVDAFRAQLLANITETPSTTILEVATQLVTNLILRDEFLSY